MNVRYTGICPVSDKQVFYRVGCLSQSEMKILILVKVFPLGLVCKNPFHRNIMVNFCIHSHMIVSMKIAKGR